MAEKIDYKELVSLKEMMMANPIQVGAICRLFIEKGLITQEEFYDKLKLLQAELSEGKNKIRP